jgi:hypothetical protein
MDKVRFGRALGYGARHAAKAVAKAVDAATTPSPVTNARPSSPGSSPAAASPASRVAAAAAHLVQAHETVRQVRTEARSQTQRLARSVWSRFGQLSGVLWLEVTGTFFAVMAAYLSQGLWRQRGALRLPIGSAEAGKFYLHVAAFAVFVYFAVSSFVRARRRQKG